MTRKTTSFKTKGMNRDLSVSAFNSEFSFDNKNLRLSTKEGNTMMSWVNERGPKQLELEIDVDPWLTENKSDKETQIYGIPIGTAIIDHQLVLFTTSGTLTLADAGQLTYNDNAYQAILQGEEIDAGSVSTSAVPAISSTDRIYVFKYSDTTQEKLEGRLIFEGNLNFSSKNPLETLVAYESSVIEKVYFNDGNNQPRMINIKADNDKLEKWNSLEDGTIATFFDFVPAVTLKETFTVTKNTSEGGLFPAGTIQYCLTYINKYGQQSNVVAVSPLFYLTHNDRGASAEDSVSCSFNILIGNADSNFDYIRLYSVQRTSIDDTPIAKFLGDIEIDGSDSYTFVDNGTVGSSIDPMELLFIGGREISAFTMADKDNTLFLGNLTEKNTFVGKVQDYFDSIRSSDSPLISFSNNGLKTIQFDHAHGVYSNTNLLNAHNQRDITTFKGGETYRFGIQFQKKTGEWLEPIWIEDDTNTLYPSTSIGREGTDNVKLVYAKGTINLAKIRQFVTNFDSVIKRVRPVIVFPTLGDRNVLCQGVLNPTVFNIEDRVLNAPYAQASWFFRPYIWSSAESSVTTESTSDDSTVTYEDLYRNYYITVNPQPLGDGDSRKIEIDRDFQGSDYIKYVYVIVADVPDDNIASILSRGSLVMESTTSSDGSTTTKEYTFEGVVMLESDMNLDSGVKGARYLFIRSGNSFESNGTRWTYSDGIENPTPSTGFFPIFNDLSLTSDNYLYYERGAVENNYYHFRFYVEDTFYTITFKAYGTSIYHVSTVDTTDRSSALEFMHYSPLGSVDDITSSTANINEVARRIEVQGAKNTYASAFDTKVDSNSNTEFFVDQSIVTLNSPDLDFDTAVQSYATEGLKLRIVGAIPITANVSAHRITRSTAMLELNHGKDNAHAKFGSGELDQTVLYNNISAYAGRRLVSDYLWNDCYVTISGSSVTTAEETKNYLVYPWQRAGSLNNDTRAETSTNTGSTSDETKDAASSWLKTKKESTLLYSVMSTYLDKASDISFEHIGVQIPLTENAEVMNYRLPRQKYTSSDINYYPNIDKALINADGYRIIYKDTTYELLNPSEGDTDEGLITSPVSMKYKSTTHAVIALDATNAEKDATPLNADEQIPLLPYGKKDKTSDGTVTTLATVGNYTNASEGSSKTFWGNDHMLFRQDSIDTAGMFGNTNYSFLWLGELYKDVNDSTRFGGTSETALKANTWLVGGDAIDISKEKGTILKPSVTLYWTTGDTYFQRYDCLKTYPYTTDDTNQLVEILSFMCETRVNIDGRYDRNRGQVDNTYMSPQNFNLLNPVYSQQDNFFNYRKSGVKSQEELGYVNQIYYTKTKTSGADVDMYTNVTLASVLEMDGDKGSVNALKRFNNQIISFQDTGIAQILYNENAAITTTEGSSIELANSGKVQGKRYLSDTIGCSNKYSIVQTPSGLYFIDNNDRSIYLFNGELQNLSTANGFNSWCKNNIPESTSKWTPDDFEDFVGYYDKLNQDILFINSSTALAYSERVGAFTSFYDYEGTPYFSNLDNTGILARYSNGNTTLWKHNAGDYCNFFGTEKPYWLTLIANPEPQVSKIFTNVELRATVDGDGTYDGDKFTPTLPFDSLEAWDEYQHGIANLANMKGASAMIHDSLDYTASMKRKFRIWRCDIPRDNAPLDNDEELGISRIKARPLDRMNNPWLYLKLEKDTGTTKKTEIHDIEVVYYS